jgi:oligopeptide transport system substrate-binding protein
MWKRELGIDVQLQNQEWGSYMQATTTLHYDVARRSWIGDYLDPNSFLELLVSGDGNNRSGFSNPRYDALMREAERTLDRRSASRPWPWPSRSPSTRRRTSRSTTTPSPSW